MEVLGIEQTRKGILAAGEAYVEALKAAQIKMGVILISKARKRVPVGTGTLRDAGYVRPLLRPSTRGSLVTIGFRARHAGAMHKGASTKKGRKSGKTFTVRYNYRNGGKQFLAYALKEMQSQYSQVMAMLVKTFVANKTTSDMVPNPYPYKAAKRAPRAHGPITYAQHLKREARRERAAARRRS